MSRLGSYKNTAFSESQKFLVLDPSTSSASLVLASELVAYITPKIGSVLAETTRLSAENTDYKVGEMIQTSGATSIGDGLASVFLVVAGGDGDFPMVNGNDLLVIVGDDALRAQLISQTAGQGASLVSMENGPTVEAAINAVEISINDKVTRVNSLYDLISIATPVDDSQYYLTGYIQSETYAGGNYVWSDSQVKSAHDGLEIISNTVPWTGAANTLPAFIAGTGETLPAGTGCFVKLDDMNFYPIRGASTTISAATPSNDEWYPLHPVIIGNTVYTIVKGSYGATTDISSLNIDKIVDGVFVNVSSSSVGGAGADARGLAIVDNYAYVGAFNQIIYVFDISDASAPTFVTSFTASYPAGIQYCIAKNNVLYAIHWGGPAITTYNISNRESPVAIGTYAGGTGNFAQPFFDERGLLWVIAFGNVGENNLYCFDINNDSIAPVLVSSSELAGMDLCRYGQIYNGNLFIGKFDAVVGVRGVYEIDISDSLLPTIVTVHDADARSPLVYNEAIYGAANNNPAEFCMFPIGETFANRKFIDSANGWDFPTLTPSGIIAYSMASTVQPVLTLFEIKDGNKDLFCKTITADTIKCRMLEYDFTALNLEKLRVGKLKLNLVNDLVLKNGGAANSVYVGSATTAPNATGGNNTVLGHNALNSATTGTTNVAIGSAALNLLTTTSENTAVGVSALSGTPRTNSTGIGFNAQVTASNQVQLGNASTTTYAYGAVQDRSDRRDKANIQRLTDAHIAFFLDVEWCQFQMNYRESYNEVVETENGFETIKHEPDGSKTGVRMHIGAIAQQVEDAMKKHNVDFAGLQHHALSGGDDVYSIGYQEFIGIQGEIIQRQSKAISEINARMDKAGI
jgi:hypothetical protein